MKMSPEQIDAEIARAALVDDCASLRAMFDDGCLAPESVTTARLAAIEPVMLSKQFHSTVLVNDWMRVCTRLEPQLAAELTFRTLKALDAAGDTDTSKTEFCKRMIRVGIDPYLVLPGESAQAAEATSDGPRLSAPTLLAGMFAYISPSHAKSVVGLMVSQGLSPAAKGQDTIPYAGVLLTQDTNWHGPGRPVNLLEYCLLETEGFAHVPIRARVENIIDLVDGDPRLGRAVTDTLISAAKNQTFNYQYKASVAEVLGHLINVGAEVEGRGEINNLRVEMPTWNRSVPLIAALCMGHQVVGRGGEDREAPRAIRHLVQAGVVDVDAVDSRGRTALHTACEDGLSDRVQALIEAGASTSLRDNAGKTPKDLLLATRAHKVETGIGMITEILELDRIVSMLDVVTAKKRVDMLIGKAHHGKSLRIA